MTNIYHCTVLPLTISIGTGEQELSLGLIDMHSHWALWRLLQRCGGSMPVQAAQWTEFLSCPICYNEFDSSSHQPISLGCCHTVCKTCLHKLHRKACPFDQTPISTDIDLLPVNCALLQLVGAQVSQEERRRVYASEKLNVLWVSCVFMCTMVCILDPRCAASEP